MTGQGQIVLDARLKAGTFVANQVNENPGAFTLSDMATTLRHMADQLEALAATDAPKRYQRPTLPHFTIKFLNFNSIGSRKIP
jgi:hypothetical protein